MGKTNGPYTPAFAQGSRVRIAGVDVLERFRREWKWHNRLQEEQLKFAGYATTVKSISFYHGGDELYQLDGVPGVWHEQCLYAAV